jgi:hypothetical protein
MAKYLSGRVKRVPQSQLTDDRYQSLALNQTEPNLGDPVLPGPIIPVGGQYQSVSIIGFPGQRYWIPASLTSGAISIYNQGFLTPPGGVSSITQLNFVGAAISAKGYLNLDGSPGAAATITVFSPGTQGQVIFNNNNDFKGASSLFYDNSTNYVGIGTTIPTQELDINGDLRLRGTIYDYNDQAGTNNQILVKNNFGGLTWVNQQTLRAGAGGTITNIQYHNDSGLVDGVSDFVFDYTNNRVGIGTTIPSVKLDIIGNTKVKGDFTVTNGELYITRTDTGTGDILANGGTDGIFGIANTTNSGSIYLSAKNSSGTLNNTITLNSSSATINGSLTVAGVGASVGIGTTNPSEKLSVYGAVESLYDTIGEGGQFILRGKTGTPIRWNIDNYSVGVTTNLFRIFKEDNSTAGANGRVYVGITTIGEFIIGDGAGALSPTGTANQQLQVQSGASFTGVGASVGIGTTNPTDPLDVNGNIRVRSGLKDFYGTVGAAGSILTVVGAGDGVRWTTPYAAGLQGLQGTQGVQGLQGTQGTQGLQGTQGTQGLQGTQGTQGLQGIQGTTGTATQGTQGTQGLQGIQGTTGTATQGTQGTTGTATQGTQGTQGLQGIQGTTGTATQGTQGTTGTATQGTQGTTGTATQGTQGTQGLQGIQGTTGTATQGTQGTTGTATQGTQGTQGLQGIQGTTGTATQGTQGTTGTATQGTQGTQGINGTSGISTITVTQTGYTGTNPITTSGATISITSNSNSYGTRYIQTYTPTTEGNNGDIWYQIT